MIKINTAMKVCFSFMLVCLMLLYPIFVTANTSINKSNQPPVTINVYSYYISGKNLKSVLKISHGLHLILDVSTGETTFYTDNDVEIRNLFIRSTTHMLPDFYQNPSAVYKCKGRKQVQKVRIRRNATYYIVPDVTYYETDQHNILIFRIKKADDVFSASLKSINPIPPGSISSASDARVAQ